MLMMTAESMLSKRLGLRFTVVLLFLLSYFRSIFIVIRYVHKIENTMITDKAYVGAYLGGGEH